MNVWLVALGGGAGAAARYAVGVLGARSGATFPWPTLAINVVGSLALGVLLGTITAGRGSDGMRLLLGVGFCGGFTTFSAFSMETAGLLQRGSLTPALLYALASVVLAVLAAFAGAALGARLA